MKKYKWVYLWIVAAILLACSVIMFIDINFYEGNFCKQIVLYVSAFAVLLLVVIRLIPFIKTASNKYQVAVNIGEMVLDLVVSVILFIFARKYNESKTYQFLYPFFLGFVFFLRGFIYLIDIAFFYEKARPLQFFVHLTCIVFGTVVIARYDNFHLIPISWFLLVVLILCGIISTVDGIKHYNNYRKLTLNIKKSKEIDEVKKPEVLIDEPERKQPQIS